MKKEDQSIGTHSLAVGVGIAVLVLLGAWLANSYIEPTAETNVDAELPAVARDESTSTSGHIAEAGQNGQELPDAARDEQDSAASDAAARQASHGTRDNAVRDAAVGRGLSNVIELLNAHKEADATVALDALMTAELMAQMSPYERSRLYLLSFNLNMSAENYEAASADLQAALESGGLDAQEFNGVAYQRGQLFVQMEDYAKAADSLELWIARPNAQPNKAAYYLLAASYYYQDRFDDARDHMETLMRMPGENQEGWYSMMASLYIQDEDYAKAKPVLEKMVELYGKPNYREQLGAINTRLAEAP